MPDFTHYHFLGQKPNEKILLVVHRHWFNILSQFFVVFLMLFLFIGTYLYLPLVFSSLSNPINADLFYFLENLFFMFVWIIFFLIWVDYYFDVWIVTDQRIVNIEQKGLFSRVVSELELENIQDITTDVHGVIPTFLNYGNLFVQTAAEKERFIFRNIPDPYGVKDLVMNLQKTREHKEEEQFGELIRKKVHHNEIG
ncbi:MAG TPA: PH domain-containing protein [Candidatus Moranbacteria bacterium]|nr:PH domain-containing protein [Candidatus Moranbacteria bacterium]